MKLDLSAITGRFSSLSNARGGGLFGRGAVPVGIDVGGRTLRLAVLESTEPGAKVAHLLRSDLARGMVSGENILDVEGVADEIVRLLSGAGVTNGAATIVVGGSDILVRRIGMPRTAREEALRALPTFPGLKLPALDLEQTQLDLAILDPDGTSAQMGVLVIAARKDAIRARQRVVLDAGLDLHAVDADSCALFNVFEHCFPGRTVARTTLVNIGRDSSLIVIAEQGGPQLVRRSDCGTQRLIDQLTSSGMVTADDAERSLKSGANPAAIYPDGFAAWATSLLDEIRRAAGSLRADATGPGEIYLAGGGALIEGVASGLQEHANVPTQVFDPLNQMARASSVRTEHPREGAQFALALGLALRPVG